MADRSLGFNVAVDADTAAAARNIGAFAANMQRQLRAAIKSLPNVKIDADSTDAERRIAEIRKELQALGDKRIGVGISAEDAKVEIDRLRVELTRLGDESASIQVQADTAAAIAALDRVEAKRREVDGKTARVKVEIDKKQLTDTVNSFGMLARNMQTLAIPGAVALATPTILALGQAALTASQSLLLLPAAGAAAGAVLGTVKLATSGLDAAFKELAKGDMAKFNEELAKLAPNAREFAQSAAAVKPAFDSMRLDVQNAAFAGMGGTLRDLANTYLPVARAGFVGIATEINGAVVSMAGFVAQSRTVGDVQTIFQNTRSAMAELSPAGAAFLQILRDIATVGSEFLPGLAAGFTEVAQNAAEFVANARETGKLRDWISQGLSMIGILGDTLLNVGAIISNVFKAANVGGEGFMATLDNITAKAAAWTGSLQGQTEMSTLFTTLRDVAAALMPLIGAIALGVVRMVETLGPAIPPLVTGLTDVFNASGPLLGLWGELAAAVLPALGAALSFLAPVLGPALFLFTAITTAMKIYSVTVAAVTLVTQGWTVAQGLLNAVMTANPIGLVVVALAALVAALVFAYNHSETFRTIVQGAWQGIKDAASAAWDFLKGVFDALSAAVSAVGGWFEQMGTSASTAWTNLGTIVSTGWQWLVDNVWTPMVTFFTVTIPAAWDALTAKVAAVWNGIVEVIKFAVTIILTIVLAPLLLFINTVIPGGLDGLFAIWKGIWEGIQAATAAVWAYIRDSIWQPLVNFVTITIPAGFQFLQGVASAVWGAIRDAINAAWQWILNNIWNPLVAFINNVIVPAFQFLQNVVSAVWGAIRDAINAAWQWILNNIWNPIINFINTQLVPKFNWLRDQVVAAWNVLRDGLQAGWDWIRDRIWQPLVNFITQTIPNGFQTGVDAVGRLWNGIKRALRDPIQIAIDIVWNNGIVKIWNEVASLVGLGQKLTPYNLPPAASGRVVDTLPGYTPGRDPYTFYSPGANAAIKLGGGESIMRPEFTKAVGPRQVNQINAVARKGGVRGVQAYLAFGGESAADFGGFADGTAALNFAKAQAGKPYVWGASGPGGYDCSGFQSAVSGVALGYNPYARRFSTASFGASRGAGGFVPGIDGTYAIGVNPSVGGGPGHMAGTLMGVNIEARGGNGVVIGGSARGAGDSMFPWKFHLGELGGRFAGGVQGPSITDILSGLWKTVTSAIGQLGSIGGGEWGKMAGAFLSKIAGNVWDWVKGKADAMMASLGAMLGGGTVPLGGSARDWIIQHESGGNPTARNPSSTASGLYQMINSTWKAYGGSTPTAAQASVAEQNAVADRYVAAKYGSWENAQRFWQAHHYYDRGGYLYPGTTLATNKTGSPERILSPTETRAYDLLRSTGRAGGDGSALLAELQQQNKLLRALRGDVDQTGSFDALIGEVRGLRVQLASGQGSAAAVAQGWRTVAELGTF